MRGRAPTLVEDAPAAPKRCRMGMADLEWENVAIMALLAKSARRPKLMEGFSLLL